jgi:hypothetical protein
MEPANHQLRQLNGIDGHHPGDRFDGRGQQQLEVSTPAPGGGTSTTTVISVVNPRPVIDQLLPSSVVVGSPDFTMTVNGTDFVDGIQLLWNGHRARQLLSTQPNSLS